LAEIKKLQELILMEKPPPLRQTEAFETFITNLTKDVSRRFSEVGQIVNDLPSGIFHIRPTLIGEEIRKRNKPDSTYIGVYYGYIMPIYAADNEEIFYHDHIPYRWNGASDITVHLHCCLANAEDEGDTFKFQVSWERAVEEEPVPVTSNDVEVQQSVLAGRIAQYDEYQLEFTIDYDIDGADSPLLSGEHLAFRVRRIAAGGTQIANNIIILDCVLHYNTNKVFGAA